MTELDLLKKPEYIHVVLNHLPIYGTILGALALAISLILRSRASQITALTLTLIAGGSAYPVFVSGQRAYKTIRGLSDDAGADWLDEHMDRAEKTIGAFYLMAALAAAGLLAKYGDRVRIRFGNLSPMEHHPIHLHGYYWKIIEMDGLPVPESAQQPGNTVLVAVGQTRTVEFIADNPGDWAMHCHMTHHTMNQMGHAAPNLIGVRPGDLNKRVSTFLRGYMTMGESGMADMGEMGMKVPRNSIPMVGAQGKHGYIDMGGMFTIVKVRKNLTSYDDPGWYENPPGTLASLASNAELQRDLGQIPEAKPTSQTP